MILIAYDGSDLADHAISVAGSLLRGGRAQVLYAWEPLGEPLSISFDRVADSRLIASEEARAREIAEAGAALARLEGFEADAEVVCSADPAGAIADAVARLRPELVVLGSRGRHGLQSVLKGSVARHVERLVRAPVLSVPAAQTAPLMRRG